MTIKNEICKAINKTNYYVDYPASILIVGGWIMLGIVLIVSVLFAVFLYGGLALCISKAKKNN